MGVSPKEFLETLEKRYPKEVCHLTWDQKKPWTLLFAVILSAQCTDKMVNRVTPALFKDFSSLEHFAYRPIEELQFYIKPTGFYRQKAKNIQATAKILLEKYEGKVPNTMDALTALPGVGRKTANVILWNLFQKNKGMVVDTHIARISRRLGFTTHHTPEKIEQDLMKHFPQESWGPLSHKMITFGREICQARNPKCHRCPFAAKCPSAKKASA